MSRYSNFKIQVGGGLRSEKMIEKLLDAAFSVWAHSRCVPHTRGKLAQEFGGDKIVLAFDIRFKGNGNF